MEFYKCNAPLYYEYGVIKMWREVIKAEMQKKNVNLMALAKMTGYTYEYLRKVFKGKIRLNEENIARIGNALGITFEIVPEDASSCSK